MNAGFDSFIKLYNLDLATLVHVLGQCSTILVITDKLSLMFILSTLLIRYSILVKLIDNYYSTHVNVSLVLYNYFSTTTATKKKKKKKICPTAR